jgi:hypothetical protein
MCSAKGPTLSRQRVFPMNYPSFSVFVGCDTRIGTAKKMKGNVQDMVAKWRQEIIAKKQERVQRILWGKKARPVRELDAVVIIQSAYRAHIRRKYTHAFLILTEDKTALAAQRIQAVLSRKLADSRLRLLKKRKELYCLRTKSSNKLSEQDRRRLYELQDEFTAEATRTINRRLLMRPNTKFAVVWKVVFVFCIGIEIAEKVAAPWLVRQQGTSKKNRTEAITMRKFIALTVVPKPASDFQQCKKPKMPLLQSSGRKKNGRNSNHHAIFSYISSWLCKKPFSTWWDFFRDSVALAMVPSPVNEWPECQEWKPVSVVQRLTSRFHKHNSPVLWFCSEPYASFHRIYRRFIDFLIDQFKVIVSVVCFLDVFVTFFTGEIDPGTGGLVPKPSFRRWVFPGLILQLLVNPSIGQISCSSLSLVRSIIKLGPARVLRWFIAVGIPPLYGICRLLVVVICETSGETEKLLVRYKLDQTEMDIFMLSRGF